MHRFYRFFALASLPIMTFTHVYAAPKKIADCNIHFKTVGSPTLVSIEGKSEKPCQGAIDLSSKSSSITLDLTKLDTGIPLRSKHLRENYLHTDKYPTATFTDIEITDPGDQMKKTGNGKGTFKGMMELHNEKRPISGKFEVKDGKNFNGDFDIDLPDFKIERPSFMGVKIVDKVYLTFKLKTE